MYRSPLQDALLREGVGKFGLDWVRVAAHISKSGGCVVDKGQCRKRYDTNLDPALQKLKNGPWKEAEVITAPLYPPNIPLISLSPPLTPSNPTSSPYCVPISLSGCKR
jgi:hypothetical protein